MNHQLRAYPEYKDSGLRWLGTVPAHWECVRLRRVCQIQTGVTLGKKYDGIPLEERPYLRVANVQNGYLNLKHVKRIGVPHAEATACALRHGDVVVTEGGDIDKLGRGAVWRGQIPGCIHQNHIFAIRPQPSRLSSRFLALVMESSYGRTYFQITAKKTTNLASTNRTTLGQFRLFLPPPEEQAVIADFLDANAALVRKFIRNRRRLIDVLNQQKQAIINKAVTRGLDSSVPLTSSGIEWLGDVPSHWNIRRLRNVAELRVSNVDKHTLEGEIAVRLCNYTDVYKNSVITANMSFMKATATLDEIRAFHLHVGDVIITKDSEDWQDIGVPALVAETADDLVCGYHLAILRPRPGAVTGPFLAYVLQCRGIVVQLSLAANGVTRYGLSHGAIKAISIPVPPTEKQEPIVKFIDDSVASLNQAIRFASREIELMREYRTRLIADVVTGKLDVRHLVSPPTSIEPEELTAFDDDEAPLEDLLEDEENEPAEEADDAD